MPLFSEPQDCKSLSLLPNEQVQSRSTFCTIPEITDACLPSPPASRQGPAAGISQGKGKSSHAYNEGVNNRVAIQKYSVLQRLGTTATDHDRISYWGARGEGISAQRLCRGACCPRSAPLFVVYIGCLIAWNGHKMPRSTQDRDDRTADKVEGHFGVCRERSLVSFFGERKHYKVEDQRNAPCSAKTDSCTADGRLATVKLFVARGVIP